MKYAVIALQGQQYKIEENDEILVDKITGKPEFKVLMLKNGDKLEIGDPELKNTLVKLSVLEEEVKGEKITVSKFKSKSRYRKKQGFRPVYSKVKIDKIG